MLETCRQRVRGRRRMVPGLGLQSAPVLVPADRLKKEEKGRQELEKLK